MLNRDKFITLSMRKIKKRILKNKLLKKLFNYVFIVFNFIIALNIIKVLI